MIADTLTQIVADLNTYLNGIYTGSTNQAQIRSTGSDEPSRGIDVMLINVEEDKVYRNHLKPIPGRTPNDPSDIHPLGGILSMRVNLYVLFSFETLGAIPGYVDTLNRLTHVLKFFQTYQFKNVEILPSPQLPDGKEFIVEINYHNVSLEDSNNMWSNLGGEQKPYAMYQIKMIEIDPIQIVPPPTVPVIRHDPIISSPDLTSKGKTLYNPDGSPQGDTNQIKHK